VLRTTIGRDELDAAGVISAYKDLAGVERDFRSMKVIDVDLRPVHHRLEDRVRSHAFICMLSTYISFHLRRSLAPLTFTDTEPPTRDDPVAPASASKAARKKAAAKKNAEGEDVRGFRELLEHLGTLTRNRMRVASSPEIEFDLVATPTPTQRRVFELLVASRDDNRNRGPRRRLGDDGQPNPSAPEPAPEQQQIDPDDQRERRQPYHRTKCTNHRAQKNAYRVSHNRAHSPVTIQAPPALQLHATPLKARYAVQALLEVLR